MDVLRIETMTATACRLPPSVPWEDATNKVQGLEFVVVELVTNTGLSGTGISYSVDIGGTSIKALIDDYLANLVIGMDPLDYERIWHRLHRQSRRLGLGVNAMAIAAIDIAVWDLMESITASHCTGCLAGPEAGSPPMSAKSIWASPIRRRLGPPRRRLRRPRLPYRQDQDRPGDLDEDIERIRTVQARLGRGGSVLVDLNQKWTACEALAKASRLDGLNLGWIEEPLLCHDIEVTGAQAGHPHAGCSWRKPIQQASIP